MRRAAKRLSSFLLLDAEIGFTVALRVYSPSGPCMLLTIGQDDAELSVVIQILALFIYDN